MKKTHLFLLMLSLLSLPAAASAENAVITGVQGSAEIMREGNVMPVTPGMAVQSGDKLKTGADCTADVAMNGVAGCRLLPGTEAEVKNAGKASMDLRLHSGNAIFNLQKLDGGSSFRVETPTAVATVRGTQFWGRVDALSGGPVTTFAVRQGSVDVLVKATNTTISLKEGQALDIAKDDSIVPSLRPALAAELEAMEQASSIQTSA